MRRRNLDARDTGGIPPKSDIDVECHRCDATTTADETEGWSAIYNADGDPYVEVLCPDHDKEGDDV